MGEDESDLCLLGGCVLLGIEPIEIQEKAGVLQYDCGLTRDEANREAFAREMGRRHQRFTRRFCDEVFDSAGVAMEAEIRLGWKRVKTAQWLMAQLAEGINARV